MTDGRPTLQGLAVPITSCMAPRTLSCWQHDREATPPQIPVWTTAVVAGSTTVGLQPVNTYAYHDYETLQTRLRESAEREQRRWEEQMRKKEQERLQVRRQEQRQPPPTPQQPPPLAEQETVDVAACEPDHHPLGALHVNAAALRSLECSPPRIGAWRQRSVDSSLDSTSAAMRVLLQSEGIDLGPSMPPSPVAGGEASPSHRSPDRRGSGDALWDKMLSNFRLAIEPAFRDMRTCTMHVAPGKKGAHASPPPSRTDLRWERSSAPHTPPQPHHHQPPTDGAAAPELPPVPPVPATPTTLTQASKMKRRRSSHILSDMFELEAAEDMPRVTSELDALSVSERASAL